MRFSKEVKCVTSQVLSMNKSRLKTFNGKSSTNSVWQSKFCQNPSLMKKSNSRFFDGVHHENAVFLTGKEDVV